MAEKEKKVTKAESKPAKPAKEKKKGKIGEAWRGFKSEVKKIVWPSWKQVLKNTGVVLVIVIICAIIIGALDYAFSGGIQALADLFRS
jgi:preprotein translocase subunit SecE